MAAAEFIRSFHRNRISARSEFRSIDDDELVRVAIAPEIIQTSRCGQDQLLILTNGGVRSKTEGKSVILGFQNERKLLRTTVGIFEHDGITAFLEFLGNGTASHVARRTCPIDGVRLRSSRCSQDCCAIRQLGTSRLGQIDVQHDGVRLGQGHRLGEGGPAVGDDDGRVGTAVQSRNLLSLSRKSIRTNPCSGEIGSCADGVQNDGPVGYALLAQGAGESSGHGREFLWLPIRFDGDARRAARIGPTVDLDEVGRPTVEATGPQGTCIIGTWAAPTGQVIIGTDQVVGAEVTTIVGLPKGNLGVEIRGVRASAHATVARGGGEVQPRRAGYGPFAPGPIDLATVHTWEIGSPGLTICRRTAVIGHHDHRPIHHDLNGTAG